MVAVAYLVKHPTVHRRNRVVAKAFGTAAHPNGLSFNGRILRYERRDESSTLSKPTMARSSMEDVSGF